MKKEEHKEQTINEESTEIEELLKSFLDINHSFIELDKKFLSMSCLRKNIGNPRCIEHLRVSRAKLSESFDTFLKAQYEIYLADLDSKRKEL